MKNLFRFTVIIYLEILFITSPLLCSNVSAENKEYFISKYNVNICIENDGSATFEEHITYVFNGKFKGVLRDIDISGSDGINDQQVFVDRNGNLEQFMQNNSGKPGTYSFELENSIAKFKVYESTKDDIKTFIFKYKLPDIVTKYNDIAEFNRKIIDKNWDVALNNISAVITIPDGTSVDNIRIFAHGPLTGESRIVNNKTVELKVPCISPGSFAEARLLFPVELVPYSKKIIEKDILQDILESEKKLAEEANVKREEARRFIKEQEEKNRRQASEKKLRIKKLRPVGNIITLIMFFVWFYITITIYVKYDKEFKYNFKGKYYRELPGDYTPAEMSTLVWGAIQPRDLMATVLDLVRKNLLILNSDKVNKKGVFNKKSVYKYTFLRNEQAPSINLKHHESFLMDWFLDEIGNGESVSMDEINEYVKSRKNSLQFKSDYDKWSALVGEEAHSLNFYDTSITRGKTLGVVFGVIYFISGILVAALLSAFSSIVLTVQGLALLVYSAMIKRRSVYGNEQYVMWRAFRRFLKDFSNLEKAEIPSITLWEHYLVYAISLGVAKDVIKQLPQVYDEQDFNSSDLTFLYGGRYGYFTGFSSMFCDTVHTVESAVSTATNIANSSNSSFSGSGGGFSGGSSGGSGGGGGGGAF